MKTQKSSKKWIGVRVPKDVAHKIHKMAEDQGVSRSQVIFKILEEMLEERDESTLARAHAILGARWLGDE